jgi:hypothetical protein
VGEVLVGADPDCHLVVDLPGVSPIHARIWTDLDRCEVQDTSAPRGLFVNDSRVEGKAAFGPGDVLWLGPPREPESVCVQCHFEPWVEVLPASAVVVEEGVEDDPFFVGEQAAGAFVTPPRPAPDVEVVEAEELEPSPALPVMEPPVEPEPLNVPSPEALVAETVADDWAIAAEEAPPAPAAPVASDEFFVAEEIAEAEVVEAEPPPAPAPVVDLPPLEPLPPLAPPAPLPAAPASPPAPVLPPPPPAPVLAPIAPEAPLPIAPEASPEVLPSEPPPPPEPMAPSPAPLPEAEAAAERPRSAAAPARRPPTPSPRPAPSRRPTPAARSARRRPAGPPAWVRPVALGVGAAVVLGGLALVAARLLGGGVRVDAVEPARVRVGQRAVVTGSGFAPDPASNTVQFEDRTATVLQASPTRLEVQVPDVPVESGAERAVAVVVRRGAKASNAVQAVLLQGPRLHGISPQAALPGEEVVLAGAGWGVGATVRFGDVTAEVAQVDPTRIRVVVPAALGVGTAAPIVVSVAGLDSNAVPFVVGRLPVVVSVSPASASAGDTVDVAGLGFQPDPPANDVRVGGTPALVLAATPERLQVAVPWTPTGETQRPLEVRVAGSDGVGQAALQLAPPADPVEFRFAPEPFTAVPGRPHAVVASGLGPAFVLAASGGKTAAARAVEAANRLNAAAQALRTTVGLTVEARDLGSQPVLGLVGRPDVLLEVTPEDAAAYGEDWTSLRGRGGPVTPARLARWWEAVARDIVLLTVRGERPQAAAALAPEGRVLGQLFDAARRTGRPGVPRSVVDEGRLRDGLRLLALRVPAAVAAPSAGAASAPGAPEAPAPSRLQLEGTWIGSQVEQGQRQYLTVEFRRGGGTIAYEGGITLTVPLLSVEGRRDQARFSVQIRGGVRHYAAKWDGEALRGSISTDAAGRNVVASFELRRR